MNFLENLKLKLGLGWRKEIKVQRAPVKVNKNQCVYDTERGKMKCPPKTRKTNKNFV